MFLHRPAPEEISHRPQTTVPKEVCPTMVAGCRALPEQQVRAPTPYQAPKEEDCLVSKGGLLIQASPQDRIPPCQHITSSGRSRTNAVLVVYRRCRLEYSMGMTTFGGVFCKHASTTNAQGGNMRPGILAA